MSVTEIKLHTKVRSRFLLVPLVTFASFLQGTAAVVVAG